MNFARVILLTSLFAASMPAISADYPSGPVRLVVPFPAGGGLDTMARPLADRLSKIWGKAVIVDNKPGASTIIGSDAVAKAKPDGLTLLFTADSSITSNQYLFDRLPYDPLKDLAPITQLVNSPMIIAVNPTVNVNTMPELVAAAKAAPNKLNYSSMGAGTTAHLLFEKLRMDNGTQVVHIPYKGYVPALNAAMAGEVQVTMISAMSLSYFQTGKMKAIAVDSPTRLPLMPNLPTLKETGYGYLEQRTWYGMFAPAGTDPAILQKIRNDVVAVLSEPQFEAASVLALGYRPVGSTPDEFAKFIKTDAEFKGNLIKAAGIKAE